MPPVFTATGHRNTGPFTQHDLLSIALDHIIQHQPAFCISGMALGWDLAFARAAIIAKVPLICAIPFPQQARYYTHAELAEWDSLRKLAAETHYITSFYKPNSFQLRNEWMINRCSHLIAFYSGVKTGGTANAIRYAKAKPEPRPQIINLYPRS